MFALKRHVRALCAFLQLRRRDFIPSLADSIDESISSLAIYDRTKGSNARFQTLLAYLSSEVGWFTRNRAKRRTDDGAAEAQMPQLAAADRAERAEADYSAAFH